MSDDDIIHTPAIRTSGLLDKWQAVCNCGWEGRVLQPREVAIEQYRYHIAQVEGHIP